MRPIKFNESQRARLLKLDLIPEVIAVVEAEALPVAKGLLEKPPRLGDVRSELREVHKALQRAQHSVAALMGATDAVPYRQEARSRVRIGPFRAQDAAMQKLAGSFPDAIAAVAEALDKMPAKPTRHRTASPAVVNEIYRAVQKGYIMAGLEPLQPHLAPSVSPGSRFRELIGICYEALGAPSSDPERAIKAYLKQWRQLEALTERLQPGQNVPQKIDVPS